MSRLRSSKDVDENDRSEREQGREEGSLGRLPVRKFSASAHKLNIPDGRARNERDRGGERKENTAGHLFHLFVTDS